MSHWSLIRSIQATPSVSQLTPHPHIHLSAASHSASLTATFSHRSVSFPTLVSSYFAFPLSLVLPSLSFHPCFSFLPFHPIPALFPYLHPPTTYKSLFNPTVPSPAPTRSARPPHLRPSPLPRCSRRRGRWRRTPAACTRTWGRGSTSPP